MTFTNYCLKKSTNLKYFVNTTKITTKKCFPFFLYLITFLYIVAPRWYLEPMDTAIMLGNTISINCEAEGYPIPTITWFKGQGKCMDEKMLIFYIFIFVCISFFVLPSTLTSSIFFCYTFSFLVFIFSIQ